MLVKKQHQRYANTKHYISNVGILNNLPVMSLAYLMIRRGEVARVCQTMQ